MPLLTDSTSAPRTYAIETHYHVLAGSASAPATAGAWKPLHVQLHRMGYRPAPTRLDCFEALTDNGRHLSRTGDPLRFAHG